MKGYALAYFLPVHRIEVQTPLSPSEVASRLDDATRSADWSGDVTADAFRLKPEFLWRKYSPPRGGNPYLPSVRGVTQGFSSGGSRVTVTMMANKFGMVFIAAVILYGAFQSDPVKRWIALGGALVFHLVWCGMGFVPAAKLAEQRIRDLFPAA